MVPHYLAVTERDRIPASVVEQYWARLLALAAMSPRQRWLDRSPREIFETMPSLHGETFGFVLGDALAGDPSAPLIIDDFRTLPRDVAPLLSWPGQAVFVISTPQFRRAALTARYSDPARAGASWGDLDSAAVLEARLARDSLWDREVSRQARELGLPVLSIDGSRTADDLATGLARLFRLPVNGGGDGI